MKKLLEHTYRPDITFNRNGIIRISSRLVKLLDIHRGDSINIAVSDGEYLLHTIHHDNSFLHVAKCFPSKKGSSNYRAQSAPLCRALMESLRITCDKVSFTVGEPTVQSGIKYVPIITLRPL